MRSTSKAATASPARGSRASHLVLLEAVFRKQLTLMIRYPVNTISQLVTIYAIFAVMFFGGQAVAGAALDDSLGGIIVGFFLFTMAIVAYSGLSWDITREAQWGTLEQLFMSPYGFGHVMAVKVVVNVFMSFLWGSVILLLMLVTTGETLSIDLVTVLPVGILTLASAVGVGFVFAGAALLYKRIENAFQLVQFGFIGLIAAPVSSTPVLKWLPLSAGSHALQRTMRQGVRLWELSPDILFALVVTAVVYLGLGYLVFQRAQVRARRKGLMGQY